MKETRLESDLGKDLHPHGEPWVSLWTRGPFLPACTPSCSCWWPQRIPGLCSRRTVFHWKPNFLKNEPGKLHRWYICPCNSYPGSVRLQEEDGEGWWAALFMFYRWANLSHTPACDLSSCPHKGILALALVLTSPNWAQASVWLECADVLPGFSWRTSWDLPNLATDLVWVGWGAW